MAATRKPGARAGRVCAWLAGAWLVVLCAVAPATSASFPANHLLVTTHAGDLIELDREGSLVRRIQVSPLGSPIRSPALGPDGRVYLTVPAEDRLVAVDGEGAQSELGAAPEPRAIEFLEDGRLLVAGRNGWSLLDLSDSLLGSETPGSAVFGSDPVSLLVLPDGRIVASGPGEIVVTGPDLLAPTSHPAESLGGLPPQIGFDRDGRVLVPYPVGATIERALLPKGAFTSLTTAQASVLNPIGIAVGPDDRWYLADDASGEIHELTRDGRFHRSLAGAALERPHDLLFSPFVFEARVRGTLRRAGEKTVRVREDAVLRYAPGSGRVSLELADAPGNPDALASVLGSRHWVLRGTETLGSKAARAREFGATIHGVNRPDAATGAARVRVRGRDRRRFMDVRKVRIDWDLVGRDVQVSVRIRTRARRP